MSPHAPFPPIRLPEGIAFALMPPDAPAVPLPLERALLSPDALPARVAEFGRGRAAARRVLAVLGVSDAEHLPILREGPRAPRWPEGIVGAIAHSAGWAAAVCARRGAWSGLGIDLERVRPVKEALAARIARPDEFPPWRALPIEDQPLAFARMFSAKESIYKALFPASGIFLGYQDARVDFAQSGASDPHFSPRERGPGGEVGFTFEMFKDSGAAFPIGFRGTGRAWTGGGMVLTAVWV